MADIKNTNPYTHPNDPNLLNPARSLVYDGNGNPSLSASIQSSEPQIVVTNIINNYHLAAGLVPGADFVEVVGVDHNLVQASGNKTVWYGSSSTAATAQYKYLDSAEPVYVASSHADDDITGPNARRIRVDGLDGNHDPISEEISLAGISPTSFTTASFLRVLKVTVIEVGTENESNKDTITVETSDGIILGFVAVSGPSGQKNGVNESKDGIYTIPAGYSGFINQITISVGEVIQTEAVVSINVREYTPPTVSPPHISWDLKDEIFVLASTMTKLYPVPIFVPEKADVEIRAYKDDSDGNSSELTVSFNMILIED